MQVAAPRPPHPHPHPHTHVGMQVAAMLDEGVFDMARFAEGGWVDGLKYEDEVEELLKPRTGGCLLWVGAVVQ